MRSQLGLTNSQCPPNDFDLFVKPRRQPFGLDDYDFAVANLLRLMTNRDGILSYQADDDEVGGSRGELRIEAVRLTDDQGVRRKSVRGFDCRRIIHLAIRAGVHRGAASVEEKAGLVG
jgi:hypothetical protein